MQWVLQRGTKISKKDTYVIKYCKLLKSWPWTSVYAGRNQKRWAICMRNG